MVKLKYLGLRSNLDFKMDYLVAGPYHVEGPGDVFEVDDADVKMLLERNPKMLVVVKDKPVEMHTCPVCEKIYKTEAGMQKHLVVAHGYDPETLEPPDAKEAPEVIGWDKR